MNVSIIWDLDDDEEGNVQHIAEHGIEKDDVAHVFDAPVGTETSDWSPGWLEDPELGNGRVSGVVVTVDSFGNLITNIDASLIEGFENAIVHVAGHDIAMNSTYGRVKPGEYLALINSFGVVEIARSEESAAGGLGCERGAPVIVSDLGEA